MSDDRLPDTDDPYELLGIDQGADERTAKRAYVRLIKRFKPDKAPEQFKRIHAAHERVKQTIQLGPMFEVGTADADEIEEVRDEEAAGGGATVAAPDEPNIPTATALEDADASMAYAWSWTTALQAQSIEAVAVIVKLRRLIESERTDELLVYLVSDDCIAQTARSPMVEGAAVLALASLAFSHPDDVGPVRRELPGDEHLDHCYLVLDDMLALAEDWHDTAKRMICPAPLNRLMRLGRAVSDARRETLIADFLRAYDDDRETYLAFFRAMGRESAELFVHLHLCLDTVGDLERVPVDQFPHKTQQEIAEGMRHAERALHGRADFRLFVTLFAVAIAGFAVLAILEPEAGGAGIFSVVIFSGIIVSVMRERFYRLGPSPRLAELADRTGVGPVPLARWLQEHKSTAGRLRRYIDAVEQDATVYGAAIVYAARQDPEELADQIGHALFHPPPLDDDERVARMSPEEFKEHFQQQRERQKENTKRDAVIVALIMTGVVLFGLLALGW